MELFFVTLIVLFICAAFIGIRIILIKDGEFQGTCSTRSEFLKQALEEEDCGCEKKKHNLCKSHDESGLAGIADLTSLKRKSP